MTQRSRLCTSVSNNYTAMLLIAAPLALSLGGCSQSGLGGLADLGPGQSLAAQAAKQASADAAQIPQSDLQKATQYWGIKFAKNPRDPKLAINYARNLKAMGQMRRALSVMQQSSIFNGKNRDVASEYGRLALVMGQVGLASKILARADDPAKPDWRVVSARGTALAKQGRHKQALSFFERASTLAPTRPSVLNNLAMAYTMDGRPQMAEGILRKAMATAKPALATKIRQNLTLVLGLQGKYDEARMASAMQASSSAAATDVSAIRKMVKLPPKLSPAAEADRIVQLARTNASTMGHTNPIPKVVMKRHKRATKKTALRHGRITPAPTYMAPVRSVVAQTNTPLFMRSTAK